MAAPDVTINRLSSFRTQRRNSNRHTPKGMTMLDAAMSQDGYVAPMTATAVGSLPIRIGRQFGSYRKLGKTHQNVLCFYKGDIKAIPQEFGEIEVTDLLGDSELLS